MSDWERRTKRHEEHRARRLERIRRVVQEPGARARLSALRRLERPFEIPRRRRPSLALVFLFVVVLGAVWVMERA